MTSGITEGATWRVTENMALNAVMPMVEMAQTHRPNGFVLVAINIIRDVHNERRHWVVKIIVNAHITKTGNN